MPADSLCGMDRHRLEGELLHQFRETPIDVCGGGEPRRWSLFCDSCTCVLKGPWRDGTERCHHVVAHALVGIVEVVGKLYQRKRPTVT